MRKSSLRLYAPFIGLALAQALFISFLPSKAPGKSSVASGGLSASNGAPLDAGGSAASAAGGAAGSTGAVSASGVPQSKGLSAAAAQTASAFLGNADVTKVEGDKSHCKGDRQTGLVYSSPPCVAKWPVGANNGGATFQGVSDKNIKVVIFSLAPNDQVNTILATQGLAESKGTRDSMDESARLFINKYFEFYGRQVQIEHFDAPNCPTTPPNPTSCAPDAQKVIDEHPAMVIMESGLYSSIFDQFARAGIPTIGGNWFDSQYFTGRRPYRYDIVMDGTQSAQGIAEYYCKKMAGKNADHSGQFIHDSFGPTHGARGTIKRRLGVITPDDPANIAAANVVASNVQACDGYKPKVYTYASDINRAQEQTDSTTAGLIQDQVTTVVCMCDPIAPVFGTNGFTRQHYFPEILGSGEGFTDYDLVGRLYDKQQMAHAFGPSQLTDPLPIGQSEAAIVWHDNGNTGDPCLSCNLNWAYFDVLGQMIQQAGPTLNPLTLERGMISQRYTRGGWEADGHRPDITLEQFGPGDYTGGSDWREVYWSETAISKIDGKQGAYISTNGGKRFTLGQFDSSLGQIPVPAA